MEGVQKMRKEILKFANYLSVMLYVNVGACI